MKLKVIYKNKKYDDTFFRNVTEEDGKKITDWWFDEDNKNEPIFISKPLQFKFIRDDIFNIEIKSYTNTFKNPDGILN